MDVLMNEWDELVLLIKRHRAVSDHLKQYTRSQLSMQLILGDLSKCQHQAVTVEPRMVADGSLSSTEYRSEKKLFLNRLNQSFVTFE